MNQMETALKFEPQNVNQDDIFHEEVEGLATVIRLGRWPSVTLNT